MNSVNLSKRLQVVADYVEKGARLADIGSDHAYLPCYLAQNKQIDCAVAGEVVEGPFLNAVNEVSRLDLEETVSVRLGNGLQVLNDYDAITTITIAGVGGPLIVRILEEGRQLGKRTGQETLILQPNVNERAVREYLMNESYAIEAETILEENGKRYEIIKAKPSADKPAYDEKDLLFGPFLRQEKSSVFKEKWKGEAGKTRYVLEQMEKAERKNKEKLEELNARLKLIEEMIK
ncbi:tRNA (adenine22-N1)-methyltransferase [Alkalibacterium subtropicum]|uniref:tRNA (Adenine22-N1)-methyltransferase n=1 Tax=Alkalibacterium subtropicum TaxID=753702 RepID=A0A1I1JVJ2_9LACT|nr:tRNA (adenine(22)-N(1))-methyltransferase TrmK [Alkalibacterium subtropicum]SFC52594.1 tRNA (adenine22-N1)-methyltransferase [Alkalibacterium subtropicum]